MGGSLNYCDYEMYEMLNARGKRVKVVGNKRGKASWKGLYWVWWI